MNAQANGEENPTASSSAETKVEPESSDSAVSTSSESSEIEHQALLASGSKHPSRIGRWEPRRWEDWYTDVVLRVTLKIESQAHLAERYNVSAQHISNIVNCSQAQTLREAIQGRVLGDKVKEIGSRLENLSQKSLDIIDRILSNDVLLESKTEFVGSLAFKVAQGAGKFRAAGAEANNRGMNIERAIIFSGTDADALKKAAEVSNQAALIHDQGELPGPKLVKSGTDG